MFKTKTKTFIFVLEAPRDQDPGLEDYITANYQFFSSKESQNDTTTSRRHTDWRATLPAAS